MKPHLFHFLAPVTKPPLVTAYLLALPPAGFPFQMKPILRGQKAKDGSQPSASTFDHGPHLQPPTVASYSHLHLAFLSEDQGRHQKRPYRPRTTVWLLNRKELSSQRITTSQSESIRETPNHMGTHGPSLFCLRLVIGSDLPRA